LIDELYEAKCALLLYCSAKTSSTTGTDSRPIESPMDLFVSTSDDHDTDTFGGDSDTTVTFHDDNNKCSDVDPPATTEMVEWVDVAQQGGTPVGALASVRELAFAFQRASSRIYEMTSRQWWERRVGRN
jgi:predicted ATPase